MAKPTRIHAPILPYASPGLPTRPVNLAPSIPVVGFAMMLAGFAIGQVPSESGDAPFPFWIMLIGAMIYVISRIHSERDVRLVIKAQLSAAACISLVGALVFGIYSLHPPYKTYIDHQMGHQVSWLIRWCVLAALWFAVIRHRLNRQRSA
jgi:hypothetical protein